MGDVRPGYEDRMLELAIDDTKNIPAGAIAGSIGSDQWRRGSYLIRSEIGPLVDKLNADLDRLVEREIGKLIYAIHMGIKRDRPYTEKEGTSLTQSSSKTVPEEAVDEEATNALLKSLNI
ncbi:MAG TPA: hypothetical protein EYO59_10415 [Chromatiaceae bacterium]|jgi:hypothetical protein|nr:hypothetical protein [Chromatiaceae bacterium]HIO14700.1 hypothetical protein [Chromatiales bacterium]